jgi:glycosyltransferase involved in cell wall biosynthesis
MLSCVISLIERIGSFFFDGIVAATPQIARRFPKRKTVIVQNFPRLHEEPHDTQCHSQRAQDLLYLGGLSRERGVLEMVKAMELLPEACQAKLNLAGVFSPESLKEKVARIKGWRRVHFLGWQKQEEVDRSLTLARMGLVVLHSTPAYVESYPTKMFEYMSAGLPVIASNFPLWKEIVEGNKCGICVDPMDPKAIASAIQWMIDHPEEAEEMGKNGRRAVETKYNWANESKKLVGLYQRLIQAQ